MPSRHFIGLAALAYIVIFFSTASTLVLFHSQIAAQFNAGHWIAYWLINVLWLLQAWHLANWGEHSRFYRGNEWLRKAVAAIGFPVVLFIANFVFPKLLVGSMPSDGVVIFLFIILGLAASTSGFVGTRERPIPECGNQDLEQAREIQRACKVVSGGVALAFIGGGALWDTIKQFYVEIIGDPYLIAGSLVIVATLFGTLLVHPWGIVRTMARRVANKNRHRLDGGTRHEAPTD